MTLMYPQLMTRASLLESTISLSTLAPLLKERGARFVALVHPTMYGVREFYETLKDVCAVGIGLQIRVERDGEKDDLVLYAQNEKGYANLLKLSSAAMTQPGHVLPFHWYTAYCTDCITVFPLNESSWKNNEDDAIQRYVMQLPDMTFRLSVHRMNGRDEEVERRAKEWSEQWSIPVMATLQSRYIREEDRAAYKVAQAIKQNEKVKDVTIPFQSAHLWTEEEWYKVFEDEIEWVEEMHETLNACALELSFGSPPRLPTYPFIEETNKKEIVSKRVRERLERENRWDERYEKRLQRELTVIEKMGFIDYFLIVAAMIQEANEQGILTGPGRGSSASSLVAYGLSITDVDPIEYHLVFDRFLNEQRVSLPDIDVDFEDDRRIQVLQMIEAKYGKEHVAQIATYGTLSMKAILRSIFRVYEKPNEEIDTFMALVADQRVRTLSELLKRPVIRQWLLRHREYVPLIEIALQLEGAPRNVSTHAAGIIISPSPLITSLPLQRGNDISWMTQWAMGDVEAAGFVKFDVLGLSNLTFLRRILQIVAPGKNPRHVLATLPLDDAPTYQLFAAGETEGIFQFESRGMQEALQVVQPESFESLYAVNALYRPGPMDSIPSYAARKRGTEKWTTVHPIVQPIVEETYGILIYQEQVMQLAVAVAQFTFAEADLLRRELMKGDEEAIEPYRHRFIEGARTQMSEEKAASLFSEIEQFAQYSFPKSHAVAYSKIAYSLAYFKVHEPLAFYTALLSQSAGDDQKSSTYMQRLKSRGIKVLPPSILQGKRHYEVLNRTTIRVGLSSIKYIPFSFFDRWEEVKRQQNGPFPSIFDWARQMGIDTLNEGVLMRLIDAGAFDDTGQTRDTLRATVPAILSDAAFPTYGHPKWIQPKEERSLLQIVEAERAVLPFYISDHPIAMYRAQEDETYEVIERIKKKTVDTVIQTFGKIEEIRTVRTKNGEEMAFVEIYDETDTISCTIFPKVYKHVSESLHTAQYVGVFGKIDAYRQEKKIIVQQMKFVKRLYESK